MPTTWSWTSALIGATSTAAAVAIVLRRPRQPTIHLISVTLSSFHFNLSSLDLELILTIHVTNPNIVPINYAPATLSIFYDGSLLGSAYVQAGTQPPMSCQLLRLTSRLDGLQLAHHLRKFIADAARRQMVLDSSVDITGVAKVLWWASRFSVHVNSRVVVDPIFLEVIDQDIRLETQFQPSESDEVHVMTDEVHVVSKEATIIS